MKKTALLCILAIMMASCAGVQPTKVAERDYAYEAYCDSIWDADPDYYMDILVETDEYQSYLENHEEWWAE